MQDSDEIFRFPITIYYEDTDAGGVVYHANYLKFFERARTEILRSHGISQAKLIGEGAVFVVRHVDIDFLKGATLEQQLEVQSRIIERKNVSIVFCQELVNAQQEVLSRATIKVAYIDSRNMKPKVIKNMPLLEK